MRSIWTRIGIGAAGVFAAGMLVVSLAGAARSAARNAMHTSVARAGQALAHAAARADLPLLLDGTRVGSIRQVDIRRSARNALPDIAMLVQLEDAAAAHRLADCVLMPVDESHFNPDRGFRCAAGTPAGTAHVGRATFEPTGLERPIRVSRSVADEISRGDPFEASAELGGQVRISARGDSGEMVHVFADEGGVSIGVRDGMERAVLRLLADSTGASLRVRDRDGRTVRLEANQDGLVIRIDSVPRR